MTRVAGRIRPAARLVWQTLHSRVSHGAHNDKPHAVRTGGRRKRARFFIQRKHARALKKSVLVGHAANDTIDASMFALRNVHPGVSNCV